METFRKSSENDSNRSDWPEGYKVVIVAPFPPPMGGMGVQAEQLCRLLQIEGLQVLTLFTNWKIDGRFKFIEKLRGVRTLIHLVVFWVRAFRMASRNTIFHIFSNSFASFFLWTASCAFVCKMRRVPIIINYRGGFAEEFLHRYKLFVLPVLRNVSRVVIPSAFLETIFLQYNIPVQIIPNIISDDLRPRRDGVHRSNNESYHVIINRNFEPIYNVGGGVRAFAAVQKKYPEARLTLVGDGTQRACIEDLVSDLRLRNVVFTGQVDNHEVIELLNSADVLLNPTNVDNMPISLLEAMAVGVPVVSTNVGGVPYLMKNGEHGILVDKNDHKAMAHATVRVFKSDPLRRKIRDNAMRHVERCRWQNVRPQWLSLYRSLI